MRKDVDHLPAVQRDELESIQRVLMEEFAEAIGVAVDDPGRSIRRLVASTAAGAPILLDGMGLDADKSALEQGLRGAGFPGDAYDLALTVAALQRAIDEARTG